MDLGYLVSSDDSSSDDDRVVVEFVLMRKPKTFRPRIDNCAVWDDSEFFARFRMSKETVYWLTDMVKEDLQSPSNRNNAVTPLEKILIALRFYATGNIQQCSGDLSGLHKSTVCRIIDSANKAICKLRRTFISMPMTDEQKRYTVVGFYNIAKFPNVIGAIDCTHVPIINPGGDDSEYYRNRKRVFSFNVQVVANWDLKIMDVVARFPGSAHDSHIFSHSTLVGRLIRGEFGNYHLLGDRGYALKPYLLTPYANPTTSDEQLFNESQIRSRNVVERTFGVWKRRFPAIGSQLRIDVEKVEATIVATAILHNICIQRKETMKDWNEELPPGNAAITPSIERDDVSGLDVRKHLTTSYFSRLAAASSSH